MESLEHKFWINRMTGVLADDGKSHVFSMPEGFIAEEYPHKFRLKDDDGFIYMFGWSATCDDDDAFLPLDTFDALYGVTKIEYRKITPLPGNSDHQTETTWEVL